MKRVNGMGSVYRLPNGKWRAAWTIGYNKGKRIYKTKSGFTTKKEALLFLAREDKWDKKEITFEKLFEDWKESHYPRITVQTRDCYNAAFNYLSSIHYKNISTITYDDLQTIVDKTDKSYSTKRNIKTLAVMLYDHASRKSLAESNVAKLVRLPKKPKTSKDAFSYEELGKVWDAYNHGYNFAGEVLILIYTGLRLNEYLTLKDSNIDYDKKYMIAGSKTDAGKDRLIPLKDEIIPILLKTNRHRTMKVFRRDYEIFLDQIDIRKELKPHCCRHTFATLLAEKNVPPAVIMQLMGHTSYDTSLIYTHIKLDPLVEAILKL